MEELGRVGSNLFWKSYLSRQSLQLRFVVQEIKVWAVNSFKPPPPSSSPFLQSLKLVYTIDQNALFIFGIQPKHVFNSKLNLLVYMQNVLYGSIEEKFIFKTFSELQLQFYFSGSCKLMALKLFNMKTKHS